MPRLFALDKNFPQPIVGVLADFQADAQLVSLDRIDTRMSTLDDWELLLALHHHPDAWDGLITTDSSMLSQGPELATLYRRSSHSLSPWPPATIRSRLPVCFLPTSRAYASAPLPSEHRYGGSTR